MFSPAPTPSAVVESFVSFFLGLGGEGGFVVGCSGLLMVMVMVSFALGSVGAMGIEPRLILECRISLYCELP